MRFRLPRFRRPDAPAAPLRPARTTTVSDHAPVLVERAVYERFQAYAAAAWPNEIGGMLRCEEDDEGQVHITDLIILPQRVSRVTFDLDEQALAQFIMDLARTGRGSEIREWSSLIHSHPAMPPFLSGRDRANIIRLAGERHAWSLICSVWPDQDTNYCAMHFHQAGPVPLTITDYPVTLVGDAWAPSDAERAQIVAAVDELTTSGASQAAWVERAELSEAADDDEWEEVFPDEPADEWDEDPEEEWDEPADEWDEAERAETDPAYAAWRAGLWQELRER